MMRITKVLVGALMLSLVLAAPMSAKNLTISGILAWFGGPSITAGAAQFLEKHPDVELVFQGKGPDELVVSIIAGAPPDIIGLATGSLPSWAVQGLVQSVSHYVVRDDLRASDFVPAAWRDVSYQGEVWGLPLIVDPVYGLMRDKELFAEAGLDPEDPPVTIEDLDVMVPRLTRYGSDGRLEQAAIVHWEPAGDGNALYTWGFAFGGEFVDYSTGKITAHHPRNVEALEWLLDYYNRYDADYTDLISSYLGGLSSSFALFEHGRLAMFPGLPAQAMEVTMARLDFDMGISGPIRYSKADLNPAWLGGWAIAIPVGVSDPELAWEFVRTIAATREGTAAFSAAQSWFTAYIPSPAWREFLRDPILRPFVDITLNAQNTRARIPANQYYGQQIVEAMVDLYERRVFSPQEALERVSRRVEEEMVKMLGR